MKQGRHEITRAAALGVKEANRRLQPDRHTGPDFKPLTGLATLGKEMCTRSNNAFKFCFLLRRDPRISFFPENLPAPETAKFEVQRLRWHPEYQRSKRFGEWGPDLAFIRLDEGLPQVGSLKAKRSFWILNKDIATRTTGDATTSSPSLAHQMSG